MVILLKKSQKERLALSPGRLRNASVSLFASCKTVLVELTNFEEHAEQHLFDAEHQKEKPAGLFKGHRLCSSRGEPLALAMW